MNSWHAGRRIHPQQKCVKQSGVIFFSPALGIICFSKPCLYAIVCLSIRKKATNTLPRGVALNTKSFSPAGSFTIRGFQVNTRQSSAGWRCCGYLLHLPLQQMKSFHSSAGHQGTYSKVIWSCVNSPRHLKKTLKSLKELIKNK